MNSQAEQRKSWFRFRLLTVVVFMVVAGIILGANSRRTMEYNTHLPGQEGAMITEISYGYPVWIYHEWPLAHTPRTAFNTSGLVKDIAVGIVILLSTTILTEVIFRRFDNKKGNGQREAV